MDIVFWIILIVVIAVIIWWLVNRNKSTKPSGGSSAGARTDGALEGGSAAASAQAAGTAGIPTAAGFGKPAEPAAPATAEEPAESVATASGDTSSGDTSSVDTSSPDSAGSSTVAGADHRRDQAREQAPDQTRNRAADQAEWETQWSEAGSASGSSATGATGAPSDMTAPAGAAPQASSGEASPSGGHPVHHDEYTAPHAPTLPGAETAAVESTDDAGTAAAGPAGGRASQHRAQTSEPAGGQEPAGAAASDRIHGDAAAAETMDRTQSSALVEDGADHHRSSGQDMTAAGPGGHLAAGEPYGAGSAAPNPDGTGPADYTVKGDAAAMVYYEEGHPDYEQTRAEVWFESAAHAEAAGFRVPRRKRI
jgi:hypothetical protein